MSNPAGILGVHTAGNSDDSIRNGQGCTFAGKPTCHPWGGLWPGDASCLCAFCRHWHHWLCLAGLGEGFGQG